MTGGDCLRHAICNEMAAAHDGVAGSQCLKYLTPSHPLP